MDEQSPLMRGVRFRSIFDGVSRLIYDFPRREIWSRALVQFLMCGIAGFRVMSEEKLDELVGVRRC